jgi:AraC family transcriptional regulator
MTDFSRKYLHLRLKDLISNAGIRLIEISFKDKIGIDLFFVRLGEVALYYDSEKYSEESLIALFGELGFSILRDPEDVIVEKIRVAAIELIYYAGNSNSLVRNSDYISEKLEMPYEKLSRIFSKKNGRTLENYLLHLKIEKVKQLISNQEYTLSEIAYMLDYSSVQYLSNQFKKVTGMTVSQYKDNDLTALIPMEQV